VFLALYLATIYILPVYNFGWSILPNLVLTLMAASLAIGYLFHVSHNHEDLGAPAESRRKKETSIDDHFRVQICETISWGGYLSGLVVGGINFQIEHHIAPCLCPVSGYVRTVPLPLHACMHACMRDYIRPTAHQTKFAFLRNVHFLAQVYYYYLSIELEKIARHHNIPYIKLDTFFDALCSYQRHITNMGRKEFGKKTL